MTINAAELKTLIGTEIARLRDQRIADHIRALLIEPSITMRGWDYGSPGEEYPCWTVLDDGVGGIAYCEQGFGPQCPWGLVFTSGQADRPMSMGMDSGWFRTFLDAFFDSQTAIPLRIWQVFRLDAGDAGEAVTDELEWSAAWKHYDELCGANADQRYVVRHPTDL